MRIVGCGSLVMPINDAGERVAGVESPGGLSLWLRKVVRTYQQRGIPNTGDDEKRRKTAARRSKLGPGRHNIPLQYRDAAGKVAGEEGEASSRRKRQRKDRDGAIVGWSAAHFLPQKSALRDPEDRRSSKKRLGARGVVKGKRRDDERRESVVYWSEPGDGGSMRRSKENMKRRNV
mmetsp:Transcript_35319/g.71544  ORF Transcript_35319/g.71544 Transcript_35319/m.71544 type:complete len:176 (-) Transcript_35319:952-1479(-)